LPGPGGENREPRVKWLQSIESAEAAFLVMDPRMVCPSYKADLRPEELTELGVCNIAELDVYTLLVVPQDHTQIRTNLKAPIVINPKQRLAKQAILDRQDYPIQFFLIQERPSSDNPMEAAPPEKARR
jgi:flagellar assembly factor FliW